ncbi:hypothetical protein B0H19DRAFT_1251328 [Mycena capillaripes]|nr:hypothetical protein B0H19DRAFT_1251328 [Mycena capillaripes]
MTLMHPAAILSYLAHLFTRDVLARLVADCTSHAILSKRVEESLEELYREIDFRFLHLEDGTSERLWNRAVADRVRVLSIGPYFVSDALDSSQDRQFKDTARIVRGLLARFRNVEKYHILWHERPTGTLRRIRPKHNNWANNLRLASNFLAVPFTSARCLRTLTIECSLDKAEHLFLPSILLPRLEEFTLCIRDDHAGDLDAAGYIMVHHLARFLNNIHHTLRSFSFETSLSIDFSPLFSALGFFAHLSTLALSIPTSNPHLGQQSGLKAFLHLHQNTLEHFSLRGFCTNKCRSTEAVGPWLSQCLTGITFSSLNTLSVRTSFIPLEVVMLCVQQWADTLIHLDISGEYLSYEAVQDLLLALEDKHVESLKIGVTCLCPELVDMLAEYLPGLTNLNLTILFVASHRHEAPQYIGRSRKQRDSQLVSIFSENKLLHFNVLILRKERFCTEMNTRKYDCWNLREVGVWQFTKKLQHQGRFADAVRDSLGR